VADFLGLKCRMVFYQHDITVRYYLRKTLLSTDNIDTLKVGGATYVVDDARREVTDSQTGGSMTSLPYQATYMHTLILWESISCTWEVCERSSINSLGEVRGGKRVIAHTHTYIKLKMTWLSSELLPLLILCFKHYYFVKQIQYCMLHCIRTYMYLPSLF